MPAGVSVSAHWRIRDGYSRRRREEVGGGAVFDCGLGEERAEFRVEAAGFG
jgi:hypothetical protein